LISKIAILTTNDNKSPRVLAHSFQNTCKEIGIETDVFTQGSSLLSRLFGIFENTYYSKNLSFKIRQKLVYAFRDFLFIQKLKKYDLIVLSECIPNAYLKGFYDIEKLKKKTRKPIALYEVYYLGNSITHTNFLKNNNHHNLFRYDWNFSISTIAEIRNKPSFHLKWSTIGMNLHSDQLKPFKKKELIAIVDFEQEGYSEERLLQLSVLSKFTSIRVISLEKKYTTEEIRELYKSASLFFVQFPEAFGVSIAECLAFGCMIVLKQMDWAMSWRLLDAADKEYLPDCFYVYENMDKLETFLSKFVQKFSSCDTSQEVFDIFLKEYPTFYFGDADSLKESLVHINNSIEYKI
jgi:hypothetical protein